jgi:hypothetical protein
LPSSCADIRNRKPEFKNQKGASGAFRRRIFPLTPGRMSGVRRLEREGGREGGREGVMGRREKKKGGERSFIDNHEVTGGR